LGEDETHLPMTWQQLKQKIKDTERRREEKLVESERLQQRVDAGCIALATLTKEHAKLQLALTNRKQTLQRDKQDLQKAKDDRKMLQGDFEELMNEMDKFGDGLV